MVLPKVLALRPQDNQRSRCCKGTKKAVGGAASATKNSRCINEFRGVRNERLQRIPKKVQSMRDALEEVWARSVEDKLFEDINPHV